MGHTNRSVDNAETDPTRIKPTLLKNIAIFVVALAYFGVSTIALTHGYISTMVVAFGLAIIAMITIMKHKD